MAHGFAIALQHAIRIGQCGAVKEPDVYVRGEYIDVAEGGVSQTCNRTAVMQQLPDFDIAQCTAKHRHELRTPFYSYGERPSFSSSIAWVLAWRLPARANGGVGCGAARCRHRRRRLIKPTGFTIVGGHAGNTALCSNRM